MCTIKNIVVVLYGDIGVWLSLVERFVRDEEVACSNPVTPTMQKAQTSGLFSFLPDPAVFLSIRTEHKNFQERWICDTFTAMKRELSDIQMIERSIIKKYRKELWAPFLTAIRRYDLIRAGDHIAVCISGGKDSMCMAKLLQMLQRHSDVPFELTFLTMDPGYNAENCRKIEENAARLQIPLTVFETRVFDIANTQTKSPCYLCARMRRGYLYNEAKNLGCNKIALGHHLNDVIETTVMAMFYSSKLETIVPKCHSENFEGMELIRPMYGIKEEAVLSWSRYNSLEFIQCACRFTEESARENAETTSKRREIKELIRNLKQENPEIEDNIFRALHAVHIETFPGYKKDGSLHSFLEEYGDDND